MITILPQPIRFELTVLVAELEALASVTRLKRPISPHTIDECVKRALESTRDLEALLTDYFEGCVDEEGEVWHPDDGVRLVKEPKEFRS